MKESSIESKGSIREGGEDDAGMKGVEIQQKSGEERYQISHKEPIKVGRGTNKWITDRWLHNWQLHWLQSLRLRGPNADFAVTFRNENAELVGIDGRLWAFLRVVYASSEEELLRNGYDPWLLQLPGSMISVEREAEVIKTMIGILAVMLRVFGTNLDADIQSLRAELVLDTDTGGKTQVNSDDIIKDVHKILRSVFKILPPPSLSPTVRRSNARLAAAVAAAESAAAAAAAAKAIAMATTAGSVEDMIRNDMLISDKEDFNSSLSLSSVAQGYDVTVLSNKQKVQINAHKNLGGEESSDGLDDKGQWGTLTSTSSSSSSSTPDILGASEVDGSYITDSSITQTQQVWSIADIESAGNGLPVNVREALKLRIRKKYNIHRMIQSLADKYRTLRKLCGEEDDLYQIIQQGSQSHMNKIRDLLDDVPS